MRLLVSVDSIGDIPGNQTASSSMVLANSFMVLASNPGELSFSHIMQSSASIILNSSLLFPMDGLGALISSGGIPGPLLNLALRDPHLLGHLVWQWPHMALSSSETSSESLLLLGSIKLSSDSSSLAQSTH